jgi:Spy/CpxP family protein refolding chaperone
MKAFNKYSIFTLIITLVMFASLQAQPQTNVPPKKQHKELGNKGFWGQLNLTPEQKAKVDELSSAHQKAVIDMKADLEKLHIDKKDLIRKGDFDRKAIIDLEEQMMKLQNKIHMAALNHRLDVVALLTPEQKEKVKNLKFWLEKKNEKEDHQKMKAKNFNKSK